MDFDAENLCSDFGEQPRESMDITDWAQQFVEMLAPATGSALSVSSGQTFPRDRPEDFEELARGLCEKMEVFLGSDYGAAQDATWLAGHFAAVFAQITSRKVSWRSLRTVNDFGGEGVRKENIRHACINVVRMLHSLSLRVRGGDRALAL
jgi:hypothetical protein